MTTGCTGTTAATPSLPRLRASWTRSARRMPCSAACWPRSSSPTSSTRPARAAELGDAAWRAMVERHHAVVRPIIGRYGGTEVDTAGDGFFATFDGPGRGGPSGPGDRQRGPGRGGGARRRPHGGMRAHRREARRPGDQHRCPHRCSRAPIGGARVEHGEEPGGRLRHGLRRSGQPSAQGRSRRVANLGRTLLSLAARDAKVAGRSRTDPVPVIDRSWRAPRCRRVDRPTWLRSRDTALADSRARRS